MKRDENTYGSIGDKYDEYTEIAASKPKPTPPQRGLPPQRPFVPDAHDDDPTRKIFAGVGLGLALRLLILSALSFMTAGKWSGLERDGAATGYTLVGIFLLIASIGGGLATWNHNFRVLTRPAGGHH